jgi:hypothetical protein
MSCCPYGVRTLSGQAPGMALYKYTPIHNIGGRPPVNYKVHAMFSLTLQTKKGFKLSIKINLYALTAILTWLA